MKLSCDFFFPSVFRLVTDGVKDDRYQWPRQVCAYSYSLHEKCFNNLICIVRCFRIRRPVLVVAKTVLNIALFLHTLTWDTILILKGKSCTVRSASGTLTSQPPDLTSAVGWSLKPITCPTLPDFDCFIPCLFHLWPFWFYIKDLPLPLTETLSKLLQIQPKTFIFPKQWDLLHFPLSLCCVLPPSVHHPFNLCVSLYTVTVYCLAYFTTCVQGCVLRNYRVVFSENILCFVKRYTFIIITKWMSYFAWSSTFENFFGWCSISMCSDFPIFQGDTNS